MKLKTFFIAFFGEIFETRFKPSTEVALQAGTKREAGIKIPAVVHCYNAHEKS